MSSRLNRTAIILAIASWQACTAASFAATNTAAASAAGTNTGSGDSLPANLAPTADDSDIPDPINTMSLLDKAGVGKKLDDLGINIYGHVEGGFTYQFLKPNDYVVNRNLDFKSNSAILNQAAINFEKLIPVSSKHFDLGFRVELLEGTDAAATQSLQSRRRALNSNGQLTGTASDGVFDFGGNNSSYQFDIPDFYVDLNLPLARGVRVRAGRFEFFKPIDPNDRIFYSTTFAYNNALPFTNTGVTVAYDFTDHFGIEAGFSRGYNITVDDDNGSIDFLGKAHLDLNDRASLVATTSVGPELADDSRDYTVLVDLAAALKLSKSVSFLIDGLYAHQFGNSETSAGYGPVATTPPDLAGHLPASYYGVSGNLVWQVNSYFSLAGRAEWFRDDGGLLTSQDDYAASNTASGYSYLNSHSRTLYEATVGTTITPFPHSAIGQNLKIRPEVRYDYCNRNFFGPDISSSGAGHLTRRDQLTFGADIIYNF